MNRLSSQIIDFFQNQRFVIVSSIDAKGRIHNSCKGIVDIRSNGNVYLFDLYLNKTLKNLKKNPSISITAVDEHAFTGYCLKGKARIVGVKNIPADVLISWEQRLNSRISHRMVRNIQGDKKHPAYPEAYFPKPEYMIVMRVSEITDLTPAHLKNV